MSKQTDNGRAFEWAVASSASSQTGFPIQPSSFSTVGQNAFLSVSAAARGRFMRAADASVAHILAKESSKIASGGKIVFNTDAKGLAGDVRDVLIVMQNLTIGFSCKNNHEALKHSRLSGSVDFVEKWGIDPAGCSADYWNSVRPLFNELREIRTQSDGNFLWGDLPDKATRFYWPILDAWANELVRISEVSALKQKELCEGILSYLVGNHDFYKIICEGRKSVQIQAWNFNNTLATRKTKYPDCINAINNLNGGQYSKTVVFNRGYSLNFRIHNASSRVEPSLKFDINAIGLPTSEIYQNTLDC